MRNEDFSIEEIDDPRTFTGELVPDCEKSDELPFEESANSVTVLEYLGEFKALIDACGQVSYFFNMKKFVKAGVNKAKSIASAYHHDLRYYNDQLAEWKVKAERSFAIVTLHALKLGYRMPEKKHFLNLLTLYETRRKAYKDYLSTCLKNQRPLSPNELEAKYQKRLQKALEKKHM